MVWEFQCQVDDCEFSASGNDEDVVVESAQQHMRDKHGNMPTRDEIRQFVIGPG